MPKLVTTKDYKSRVRETHGNSIYVLDSYKGNAVRIRHKCRGCGNVWKASPSNVTNISSPTGCPECNHRSFKYSIEEARSILKKNKPGYRMLGGFSKMTAKAIFQCEKDHVFETCARQVILKSHGCPTCKAVRHSDRLKYTADDIQSKLSTYKDKVKIIKSTFIHQTKPADFTCNRGHIFTRIARAPLDGGWKGCPYCNKSYNQSYVARECLTQISKKTRLKLRTIDHKGEYLVKELGYKLDGYNFTYNIGFEFHGDYFHGFNGSKITSYKRYLKTLLREHYLRDHVHLLTVWEYEWRNNPNGVLRRIVRKVNAIKLQPRRRLHR